MAEDTAKERVRDAVDIVQVVGERIPLKRAGKNFVARCPFHNEKTPSFNVNSERQIYHCFGCGVGGDVFSFVMAYDKVSFPEALRSLAERAGIQLDDRVSRRHQATKEANDPYYEANALARSYFVDSLNDEKTGKAARQYLKSRSLSVETIQKFGIGFAPDSWDGLLSLARTHNITPKILVESGLAVQNDRGRTYDRFRDRVTFPITNETGRVVAFGARTLDPDGVPKYLNSSESPVYRKNRILYGLFHARDAIRREGLVLVVEGYMDVIRLVQEGIENVVATCGTALTEDHGRILKRYADRIALVFDGDDAGQRAAARAGEVLMQAGVEALVVLLPEGDDPDTLVASEGPDALRGMAHHGTPFMRFRWNQLAAEHNLSTVTGRNHAISDMLDIVAEIDDEMNRTLMAGQVAEWGGVDDRIVLRAINKRRSGKRPRRAPDTSAPNNRRPARWRPPSAERELIACMIDRPWVCDIVAGVGVSCFTDSLARRIANRLIGLLSEGDEPSIDRLLDDECADDPAWSNAVASLGQITFETEEEERAVQEIVANVRLPALRNEELELKRRLHEGVTGDERREVLCALQKIAQERTQLATVFQVGAQ